MSEESCVTDYEQGKIQGRQEAHQEMLEKIEEMEKHNPYPSDMFTGVTEEGRIGKFAGKVWKDCLSELRSFLREEEKEGKA